MTDKTEIWSAVCTPPQSALKKIQAGRLKGMSDINPQWRLLAMTETFGPVGIGWKYSIDKLWLEPGSQDQVCAFAIVNVQVHRDDKWSEPVPGIGGSMLIAKEKSGLHTSDEAYKMAVTDALSVALKAFGVAGDVYMGMIDGSKYQPQQQSPPPAKKTADEWVGIFKSANIKSSKALADWRMKNGKSILATIANKGESDKLKTFLDAQDVFSTKQFCAHSAAEPTSDKCAACEKQAGCADKPKG